MSLMVAVTGTTEADLQDFQERHSERVGGARFLMAECGPEMRYGGQAGLWDLAVAAARGQDCGVVGLVHADTWMSEAFLASVERACLDGPTVAGIVGRSIRGFYIWASDCRGDVPVSTLDGCSVFASLETVARPGVAFDPERFESFHCAVEDFCLSAAAAGCRVVVPPGEASHRGSSSRRSQWLVDYSEYRARLEEKWRGRAVFLTT